MADAKVATFETQDEIDSLHFTVGMVVILTATVLASAALQFLMLR
jgi:hypothetical protein